MTAFRFDNVCIESFALNLPDLEVSSAELEDRIAPLYERLKIPFGTLEKLSGVSTRRLWDPMLNPSQAATEAANMALEKVGFDKDNIRALFNCSVTRDYFEPATAAIIHSNLGMPESSLSMDITNACIGFSNGITTLGTLIEQGVVKAGIIVTAENVARIIESTIKYIIEAGENISREELIKLLPTFTLGCGSVAMVLCHKSIASSNRRIIASISRSATQHVGLCVGNGDYYVNQRQDLNPIMHTESYEIIAQASKLGGRLWKDLSEFIGWKSEELDHVFCHQVGKQVNESFYKEMGLPFSKEFSVYQRYGNLVSAALPSALVTGAQEKDMQEGDNVVLTAFGSGLNGIFTAIKW
ncbi:MAG: 3-oxoacyl-ACP synthase III [Bdellovibrionales bacterium]|nr:3-oxoacyl-ACP synthase III [Bdellovibrionales bacterium]